MDKREQINYRLLNATCANRGDALSKIYSAVRNNTSVEGIREAVLAILQQTEAVDCLREEDARKAHARLDAQLFGE